MSADKLSTDALVEAVAKRLDPDAWEMTAGVYQESHGRHYGNAESFIRAARQTARGEARAILRLAAPTIAAKALRDAGSEFGENQTIREGDAKEWLNLRAERVERGEP